MKGHWAFSTGAGDPIATTSATEERTMGGFLLFSYRAAGMGNLINPGGGELIFRGKQKPENSAAFLACLPVCGAKQAAKTSPVARCGA